MGMRLALVAVRATYEGPWTLATGKEEGLKIFGLGEGEHVALDYVIGELRDSTVYNSVGVHPLPFRRVEKYRLRKVSNGCLQPQSTTVEVILK